MNPQNYGVIDLNFTQISAPFNVQLLNSKGAIINRYSGAPQITMEYLDADQYQIRILIDENSDGLWDPGNIFRNQLPEPVIFFYDQEARTSTISLKKNWVLGPFIIPLIVEK